MLTDYRRTILYLEAVEVDRLSKIVGKLSRKNSGANDREFESAMLRRDAAIENYKRLDEMWRNGK